VDSHQTKYKENKNKSKKVLRKLKKQPWKQTAKHGVLKGQSKYRLLIDVQSTLVALKQSLSVIEDIVKDGGNILIVGTRPEYQSLLFNYGKVTGQPFFSRWVSGILTNWNVFSDNVKKFGDKLNTQTLLDWQRKKSVTEFLRKCQGVVTHPEKPGLVIFLNAGELVRPVGEAEAAGIPSMGLLNTSGNPNTLTYLIPANDNSIEVVGLFLMLVKKAIASGKAKRKVLLKRKSLIAKKAADRLKLKGNSQNKDVKKRFNKKKGTSFKKPFKGKTNHK
jgi:small subunit ribosomal protein S2